MTEPDALDTRGHAAALIRVAVAHIDHAGTVDYLGGSDEPPRELVALALSVQEAVRAARVSVHWDAAPTRAVEAFFEPRVAYTVNPNGVAPEIRAEFICRDVAVNPSTAERVAFGFYRGGSRSPWFPTGLMDKQWDAEEWWRLCWDTECADHAGFGRTSPNR